MRNSEKKTKDEMVEWKDENDGIGDNRRMVKSGKLRNHIMMRDCLK